MKHMLLVITALLTSSFQTYTMQERYQPSSKSLSITNIIFQKYMNHALLVAALGLPVVAYSADKIGLFIISLALAPKIIGWSSRNLKKLSALEEYFWLHNKDHLKSFLG